MIRFPNTKDRNNITSSPLLACLVRLIIFLPFLNRILVLSLHVSCNLITFPCIYRRAHLNWPRQLNSLLLFVFVLLFCYCRASQKLNLASPQRRKRHGSSDGAESPIPAAVHRFGTDFSGLLRRNPPLPPPHLLRRLGLRENPGVGKVSLYNYLLGFQNSAPAALLSC